VITVIVFLIVGVLTIFGILGGQHIGFSNYTYKQAPFVGGWPATLSVFVVAGFSFQGTELIGITAGESETPETSIPKAIKQVFWRILLFYILAIAVIAAIIPYTSPNLLGASASDVAISPFTLVFKRIGLAGAASVMNAVILTSVLSSANSGMYASTRMLWAMGNSGFAPRIFGKTNSRGVPLPALIGDHCCWGVDLLIQYHGAKCLSTVSGRQWLDWIFGLAWDRGIALPLPAGVYRPRAQVIGIGLSCQVVPDRSDFSDHYELDRDFRARYRQCDAFSVESLVDFLYVDPVVHRVDGVVQGQTQNPFVETRRNRFDPTSRPSQRSQRKITWSRQISFFVPSQGRGRILSRPFHKRYRLNWVLRCSIAVSGQKVRRRAGHQPWGSWRAGRNPAYERSDFDSLIQVILRSVKIDNVIL
jgi:hypothetical protein